MSHTHSRRSVVAGGLVALAAAAAGRAGSSPASAAPGAPGPAAGAATRRALALRHVTVIDPARPGPLADATVVVERGRISAVGPAAEVRVPRGALALDLRGKYVIPGLWDMHAHSYGSERMSPGLNIAHGVTSVREMAYAAPVAAWRDAIEAGHLVGPRWTIASPIVDGDPSLLVDESDPDGAIVVSDDREARAAVRRAQREGADFVKVYSRLSPSSYTALAAEARRRHLPFAGHVPDAVSIVEASDAGQRSIEHLHAVGLSTSNRDAEVRAAVARIAIAPGDYRSWFRQLHPIEWLAATAHSPGRAAEAFDRLRANDTYVCPTLAMHQLLDKPEEAVTDDDRLRYVPAETREVWEYVLQEIYLPGRTPSEVAQQRELYQHRVGLVAALHRAGVPLLAGSEAGLTYAYAGSTLHDELALLAAAGLSPLDALATATREPARFLGQEDELGAVRRGLLADLVVLDADPSADITNTTRIHGVVARGAWVSPEQRQQLLADAEAAAQGHAGAGAGASGGGCGCHGPRRRPSPPSAS